MQNEKKIILVRAITRACAITSKTVHHIMEDNFALRYVLKHPGVNSRAELVPSPRAYAGNGASRRWLGDNRDLKQTGRQRDDDGYSHNDIPDLVQNK